MNVLHNYPISISDKSLEGDTVRAGLQQLRDSGFTHIHYSEDWTKREPVSEATIERWQEDLASTGMKVLDVHGPHTRHHNLWEEDPEARSAAMDMIIARLKLTKALGGDAMVYHVPTRCTATPDVIERLLDSLARLEDTAREMDINIALENHYDRENDRAALSACFERFSPDYIGFTFDSGHGLRSGNTDWLIDNCFDRLTVLHLADNEEGQDRHWIPSVRYGEVDWDVVARAIAESPYTKPLQFEVRRDKKHHEDHGAYLKQAYRDSVKIAHDVVKHRQNG